MIPCLLFIGCPGAGKTTQSVLLKSHISCVGFSIGAFCRSEMARNTGFGEQLRCFLSGSRFLPIDIVIKIIQKNLTDSNVLYFLDPFPATVEQAKILPQFTELGLSIQGCIEFSVSREGAMSRLLQRLICSSCNASLLPHSTCVCGCSETYIREDDEKQNIQKRIDLYFSSRDAVVNEIEKSTKRFEVLNADKSPNEVTKDLLGIIEKLNLDRSF